MVQLLDVRLSAGALGYLGAASSPSSSSFKGSLGVPWIAAFNPREPVDEELGANRSVALDGPFGVEKGVVALGFDAEGMGSLFETPPSLKVLVSSAALVPSRRSFSSSSSCRRLLFGSRISADSSTEEAVDEPRVVGFRFNDSKDEGERTGVADFQAAPVRGEGEIKGGLLEASSFVFRS